MSSFDAARTEALMGDLVRFVRGRPADLLPFDVVRESLHLRSFVDRGLQEVPLDRIVGSLGRVLEFNRAFLPREEALRDRWRAIWKLADGPRGFPPVELFKVGEAYFVADGHHRVSVLRSIGAPAVEAHVKEYLTRVPLDSTASLEEVLLKSGQAEFLEATGLAHENADDFRVTVSSGYDRLLEHIAVHRYYRGGELQREVPWPEAVESWRETVWRPMIEIIRDSDILKEFGGRTETDLYLFTMDHFHHLSERFGPENASRQTAVEALRESGASERTSGTRLGRWWRGLRRRGGSKGARWPSSARR
jgi:hypothetical protein